MINCPNCLSDDTDVHDFEVDYGQVRTRVLCMDCETTWEGVYDFTENQDIDIPPQRDDMADEISADDQQRAADLNASDPEIGAKWL